MKKKKPTLILPAACFFSLLLAVGAHAAEKDLSRDFLINAWTTDNGLPQNTINGVCQTDDGYLWLATLGGLARFDGVKFVPFNTLNTPGMISNRISSLSTFGGSGLVMGTFEGNVMILREGLITAFDTGPSLGNREIRRIFGDPESGFWIVIDESVFFLKDGKISEPDIEGSPRIVSAFPGVGRRVWLVVGDKRLLCLEENRLRSLLTLPAELAELAVSLVWEDPNGAIWIGTTSQGLFQSEKGEFVKYQKGTILESLTINRIKKDPAGTLWIGTRDQGLYAVSRNRIFNFSGYESLSGIQISDIFLDKEGTLWIGTAYSGLQRIKYKSVRSYSVEDGLGYDVVFSVAQSRDGGIWIGMSRRGVSQWKNGVFTNYSEKDGFPATVNSVFSDSRNRLWIGSQNEGLFCYDNLRLRVFTVRDGLPHNTINAIYEDDSNRLWIGTNNGLAFFQNDKLTVFPENGLLKGNAVISILLDRKGALWMGTEGQGVCRFQDGRLVRFTGATGLSNNNVRVIHEDRDGVIWLGTYGGGLNRFKDGNFVSITTGHGLFDDIVSTLFEDNEGNFWMTCNRGIYQANRRELNEFAEGRRTMITCRSFQQKEGMKSEECNGGNQPAGCMTKEGRLIVPTIKGIAVLDLRSLKTNPVPPPVVIEEIIADGQKVEAGPRVTLPADTKRIEIHFSALSYVTPEKVRFRYRLEGFDSNWMGPNNSRLVYYTNIPHKSYRFKVTACNNDGVWNRTGASLDLYVRPYLYERRWFYAAGVIVAALSVYAAFRFRIRQIRKKEDMLERLVAERTRRLTAEIAEREKVAEALHESEEKYRTIIENSHEIIMLIRPEGTVFYVSPSIEKIFGYRSEELLGPLDMRLVHPLDRSVLEKIVAEAMKGKAGAEYEYRAFTRSGEIRWVSHSWSPVVVDGKLRMVVNFIRDINEHRLTLDRIQTSLREKEVLIKEIHHRVKNNMQVISSMLNLQSRALEDPKVVEIVKECQGRIRSMALVHEKLYRSDDLSHIEFSEYIKALMRQLFVADRIDPRRIRLSTDLEKVPLSINMAVPCGLIIHELITNCLKHAFPTGRDGVIVVRFRQIGPKKFLLEVRDDGVGFPKDVDFRSTKSLGMQIVNILVHQIAGTINLDRNGGTLFRIEFSSVKG